MKHLKPLALPTYLVATLLVVVPLLDTLLSVWPPRGGDVAWRFGAVGLFSRALMTPLLGLLLALAAALVLEHRRTLRVVAVLCGIAVPVLLATVSLFVLDALQMRAQVRPDVKFAFEVTSAIALGKYLVGTGILAVMSVSAWRGSRPVQQAARRDAKGDAYVLVSRSGAEAAT